MVCDGVGFSKESLVCCDREPHPKSLQFLGSWLLNKRGFAENRCSNVPITKRLKKAWREEEQNSASHHSELMLPHLLVTWVVSVT